MVRRMHEMVPQDEGEPMSEEEMATSFQRFLDARGGRIELDVLQADFERPRAADGRGERL